MDFERFQAAWDEREYDSPCEKPICQVAAEIRGRARMMKMRQRTREAIEILFGILSIVILAGILGLEIPLMVRTGLTVVVAGVVFLVMTSQIMRRRYPPTRLDIPIRKYLVRELERIQRLIRIQRYVSQLFFVSVTAGIALISFGFGEGIQNSFLTVGATVALLGTAIWFRHHVTHTKYLAQQRTIERQLQVLTSNG
jgi:hypothetical protein